MRIIFQILLFIDRVIAGKPWKQIAVATGLFVLVLLLVWSLFYAIKGENLMKAFVDMVSPVTVHEEAYATNAQEGAVAIFSFVYFLGAIFFTGVFVATITNFIRTRSEKFKQGTVKYYFRDHIVFLGYDDLIIGMIQKLCDEGQKRIVVGVESNAFETNNRIKNKIYFEHKNKVVVLQADSCNRSDLERLRVSYAKIVYIIGEHDDAYNLKSYRTIYELSLCSKNFRDRMPQCYVNLQHKSTLALFQTYATAGDIGVDFSTFHVFNFYDEWARFMIGGNSLKKESRIDYRDGKGPDSRQVHLVIVGMTEMGRALARQALLACHYPNNVRTKITFIDPHANLSSKQLIGSHQSLFERCYYTYYDSSALQIGTHIPNKEDDALDIEFEFYVADISDIPIRTKIEEWAHDNNQLLTIAICLPKASQSIAAGIYLPGSLFSGENRVPVWVYQPTYGDLGNYLRGSYYKNIITFGMSGEQLDVCNMDIVKKAEQINHFFRNYKNGVVTYDNPQWIEEEWNAQNMNEKWKCLNRASRISVIRGMVDNLDNIDDADIDKIVSVEIKRMRIENLIVPGLSSNTTVPEEEIKYIKAFLKQE